MLRRICVQRVRESLTSCPNSEALRRHQAVANLKHIHIKNSWLFGQTLEISKKKIEANIETSHRNYDKKKKKTFKKNRLLVKNQKA